MNPTDYFAMAKALGGIATAPERAVIEAASGLLAGATTSVGSSLLVTGVEVAAEVLGPPLAIAALAIGGYLWYEHYHGNPPAVNNQNPVMNR
jgi:hypothetical protein